MPWAIVRAPGLPVSGVGRARVILSVNLDPVVHLLRSVACRAGQTNRVPASARACADHGLHVSIAAAYARRQHLAATSEARWRKPPVSFRQRKRAVQNQLRDVAMGEMTHNAADELAHLRRRILNSDTEAGREANQIELYGAVVGHGADANADAYLGGGLRPDLPGGAYSIPALVQARGTLPHDPYDWPVWKVSPPPPLPWPLSSARRRHCLWRP